MTPEECKKEVINLFQSLYPGCTVIHSYPGFSTRPPVPYIAVEFGAEEVTSTFEAVEDGILKQAWRERLAFTAELVTKSRTVHAEGEKTVLPPVAAEDLAQSVRFFGSSYAADVMRLKNIWIEASSFPTPVYNPVPGVERAQCSFTVDFVYRTSEYAALAPEGKEYTADRKSAASKELADMEAGYFTEAEITCSDEDY